MNASSVRREVKGFDWTSIEPKISNFTQADLEAASLSLEAAKEEIRRRLRRLNDLEEERKLLEGVA